MSSPLDVLGVVLDVEAICPGCPGYVYLGDALIYPIIGWILRECSSFRVNIHQLISMIEFPTRCPGSGPGCRGYSRQRTTSAFEIISECLRDYTVKNEINGEINCLGYISDYNRNQIVVILLHIVV